MLSLTSCGISATGNVESDSVCGISSNVEGDSHVGSALMLRLTLCGISANVESDSVWDQR
jgi:hypothetical protein